MPSNQPSSVGSMATKELMAALRTAFEEVVRSISHEILTE